MEKDPSYIDLANDGFINNFTFSPSLNLDTSGFFPNSTNNNISAIAPEISLIPTDRLCQKVYNNKKAASGKTYEKAPNMEANKIDKGGILGRARFRKRILTPLKRHAGPPKKS